MGYSTYCSDWCVREAGHSGDHELRPVQLQEAVERIRAHHDRTLGHSPTNRVGYCAEADDISATYCETGILLAQVPAQEERLDELRALSDAATPGAWRLRAWAVTAMGDADAAFMVAAVNYVRSALGVESKEEGAALRGGIGSALPYVFCDAPLSDGGRCTRLPNHEGVHQ